ncbi:MAG: hypothetical protein ACXADH_03980 [Candidatus Kariarchaeaceae archaeon]|jgi:hypothetical protein
MITLYTRVLNGLPVRIEAETANDQFEGLIVDDIQIFWNSGHRATVNDWDMLEEEILDLACGRWIG